MIICVSNAILKQVYYSYEGEKYEKTLIFTCFSSSDRHFFVCVRKNLIGAETCSDPHRNRCPDGHTNPCAYRHPYTYLNSNPYLYSDTYGHPDTDAHRHSDTYPYRGSEVKDLRSYNGYLKR